MQRTLAIVMVPALIFLAVSIIALQPGRQDKTPADRSHVANRERGETAHEGQLQDLAEATSPRPKKRTGRFEIKPSLQPHNAVESTVFEDDTPGPAEPQREETSPTSVSVQQAEDLPSVRPGVARPTPVPSRERWISALPIHVARTPKDLVKLNSAEVIGRLTVTGDQFSNRSLLQLEGLRVISVSIEAVNISNSALYHLAKIKGLRELRLWAPGVTDDGLRPIAAMSDLEILDLEGTNAQGTGLINMDGLEKLTRLTLGPRAEDGDLALLESIPSLVELDLRPCRRLTDACAKTIAQHRQLRMVWLPSQVGSGGKQSIRQMLPNCHVRW